ncbi:MAG: D-2-hydroxyacid dehydrogenase [Rhizobiaceae bacterium]|nr:D-2-hydroxyacid dehydrogenase [Rhizobiaceae bacterium]
MIIHAANTKPLLARLGETHRDLASVGCETYEELPALIGSFKPDVVYSIRFAGSSGFPSDALLGPDGPAWISIGGSGVDHLGIWDPDKVSVTNSSGVAADMMAEFIMGGFLHFSLDIPGLLLDQKERLWRSDRLMTPLAGKTLLIIGLGSTGIALAKKAKAFGMNVVGTRANPKPTPYVDETFSADSLGNLLPEADLIAVCAPLLASTRGLIREDAFSAMKSGTVLADVSRGGIVSTDALLQALHSGQMKGAILDVFETEPLPPNHPIWTAPNVTISPHCSSVFEGWEMASMDMFIENFKNWIDGDPLENLVDPISGY